MAERYARLRADWLLRGWTDLPMAVVNWTNGHLVKLSKRSFYVARACDGQTDFSSLAFLPVHHAILDKLIDLDIVETCARGDCLDAAQRYRRADNPPITGLHWAVTGLCNLNCRHCYMESPSGRYGELPLRTMMDLIAQFERANVLEVTLTGGEPFRRTDLEQIVARLVEGRIRVSEIYTNGLLVTDEQLRWVSELGVRPVFQISFDGSGGHERMRGTTGIEADAVRAVRRVREAGFAVAIATCIDTENAALLVDTYETLKNLGIQLWRISAPQETGNWRGTKTRLSVSSEARAYEPVFRRWLADDKPFAVQFGGFFRSRVDGVSKSVPDSLTGYAPDSLECAACREKLFLLPNGTLLPCPGFTDSELQKRMPSLLQSDLSEVWSESILRTFADTTKRDRLERNAECVDCELFSRCGMGCRASALTEAGDLKAKDPLFCEAMKGGYRHRFLDLLDAQG